MSEHTVPSNTETILNRLQELRLTPRMSDATAAPEQSPVGSIIKKLVAGALVIVEDFEPAPGVSADRPFLRVSVVVDKSPLVMDVHLVEPR